MDWFDKVADLLRGIDPSHQDDEGGGRLVVCDPGGSEVFRAALARHCRLDGEVMWVRPIAPGLADPRTGRPVYDTTRCRRRGVSTIDVKVIDNTTIFHLPNGQVARIEPASGDELMKLWQWDEYVSGLSVEEERELDELRSDT